MVKELARRPEADFGHPAIWPSARHIGKFGIHIPGKRRFIADNLSQANATFAKYGIESQLGKTNTVIDSRISNGEHIRASSTDLPKATRLALAQQCQIAITPIMISGQEIAYIFSNQNGPGDTMLLSSHGSGINEGVFMKPEGVEFNFASTRNNILMSNTLWFAENVESGKLFFQDDSQIYGAMSREAKNYRLNGKIRTQPEAVAKFIGAMNHEKIAQPFDFILLNREAKGVHFADILQGLKDTLGWTPKKLICHFCRPHNEQAGDFFASNNLIK